jgi:hypothetical protein
MRIRLSIIVAAAVLIVTPAAYAAVMATAGNGTANPDGSATAPVTIACTPGSRVLEAHLSLSQDAQTISGMAGIGGVRCTGQPRTYQVTVTPFDGAFHSGEAFASPFVLVQSRRTGATESGGTSSTITLQ